MTERMSTSVRHTFVFDAHLHMPIVSHTCISCSQHHPASSKRNLSASCSLTHVYSPHRHHAHSTHWHHAHLPMHTHLIDITLTHSCSLTSLTSHSLTSSTSHSLTHVYSPHRHHTHSPHRHAEGRPWWRCLSTSKPTATTPLDAAKHIVRAAKYA